jgi:hypothetical protein
MSASRPQVDKSTSYFQRLTGLRDFQKTDGL